jgi:hypothetical protein
VRYKFRIRPYPHQVRAIRKLVSSGWGGGLLMAPRTGKTKVIIDYACMLAKAGRIRKVVVVCPNRVMGTWVRAINENTTVIAQITVWDRDGRKNKLIEAPSSVDIQWVIINYEAFGVPGAIMKDRKTGKPRKDKHGRPLRSKNRGGRYDVKKALVKWVGNEDVLGVLDESHKVKAPSGRAANMVVSTHHLFSYRVIATGTVVTKAKRAHDIYMQWKWLNPARFEDWPTVDDFKVNTGRWIDDNGFPQWVAAKPRGMEILRERIHEDSFAITREEAGLGMAGEPDVEIVPVQLNAKSGRVYDDMAETMVAEIQLAKDEAKKGKVPLSEFIEASIVLVQTLRLSQITSGIAKTDSGKLYRIGREKLDTLQNYIDDAVEHDEKLIIVARFKPDLTAITRMCREKFNVPTFELRGGVPREEADADLLAFERYDSCAVYVVQPQAASLGIDMRTAPRMIWYSLTTSWVDYTQVNDRNALFPGLRTQTYLLGENTVDMAMYEALQTDGQVARYISRRPESLLRTTPHRVR